jgi:hypothetical protein
MAKTKSEKSEPRIDGLGPAERKLIKNQVRKAWQWSHAWRLAKKRATDPEGFPFCENPKHYEVTGSKTLRVAKVFVDHVIPVGEVDSLGYIQRMFVPSTKLQCWCKKCHDPKTKKEAGERATRKRKKKEEEYDLGF